MRRTLLALTFTLAALPGAAGAQERNPFFPPPGEAALRAAEDERLRMLVREMFPEIEENVIYALELRKAEYESDMQTEPTQPANQLPPEADFVACVNGKALYRGTESDFFFDAPNPKTGLRPCAD